MMQHVVASSARNWNGGLPRLRFSRVVWLVLLSQVLSLAVVSSALWGFQKDLRQITVGASKSFYQPPPDTLGGLSTGDANRQRPTVVPSRFIGETNQIIDCIADALLARRMASRRLAEGVDTVEQYGGCDDPDANEQSEKDDGPPGGK